MKKNRKEVLIAAVLLLLTLCSGFLIQAFLALKEARRLDQAANAVMTASLDSIRSSADETRRELAAAKEQRAGLPQQKRQRLDDLHLDLLMVVSAASPLPEGYVPILDIVVGEYEMDERCAEKCRQMIEDCQAANMGLPMICSAYRTQEYQEMLYENKVVRVMDEERIGYEDALKEAATVVAVPGTSEHQTGLAADIMDEVYPYLNEWQEYTDAQQWLMEHAPDYGFILRYPPDASDITGIIYEPWHYRYVGEKFAKEISKRGLTLEEYVAWRRGR
ncbi:MAG: M15 family metallopeptidase [Oscillospiraceae bacterium]|nr:M15 family metallopeptidase [Oscillospiraceae bacterium]